MLPLVRAEKSIFSESPEFVFRRSQSFHASAFDDIADGFPGTVQIIRIYEVKEGCFDSSPRKTQVIGPRRAASVE